MTAEQLALEPYAPTLGTHRRQDRPTSVAAARSVRPGPDQQRCLEAFIDGTATIDSVCTYFERLGIRRDRGALSRRLTDLADAGFIRDSGEVVRGSRGRDVTVWRLA
jgi:hypothetical protein